MRRGKDKTFLPGHTAVAVNVVDFVKYNMRDVVHKWFFGQHHIAKNLGRHHQAVPTRVNTDVARYDAYPVLAKP